MKPYYSNSNVAIYHGDCREVMESLETVFDLVIADPSYGETSLDWDVPIVDWMDIIKGMIAKHGSMWCFGSFKMFMKQAEAFRKWKISQDIVWRKHNGSNFHADRFRRVHEHIVHLYNPDTKWDDIYKKPVKTLDATARTVRRKTRPTHMGKIDAAPYTSEDGGPRLMRSVFEERSCHGYAVHPTQKPVEIITPLIEYSCVPNGIVLDPFMGSGSTLIAARLLGVRAVGIELNEEYCEKAARELDGGLTVQYVLNV